MPWQNNGGGPWGGGGSNGGNGGGNDGGDGGDGGGGPWGGGGGNSGGGRGPGNRGPGGGGRGPQPPDIEDMLRRGQERLKALIPSGGDKMLIGLLVVIGLGIWLFTGFYRVEADEQGVVTQFGKFVRLETPGLHYHLPFPIEAVQTPKVTRVNQIQIGVDQPSIRNSRNPNAVPRHTNASMLTGDSKIVELEFVVFWQIANAGDFLFQIRDPETTVKAASESVMREIVGQNTFDFVTKDGRIQITADAREHIQELMDEYKAGITIANVQMLRADPPEQVLAAFRDVQRAAADKDKLRKEGESIERKIVPEARGEAARILEEAEAYKTRVIADSTGDANRFNNVYKSYQLAREVTKQRLYLETMEEVLRNANKVIMSNSEGGGTGVVPYLPLPEIAKRRSSTSGGTGQ